MNLQVIVSSHVLSYKEIQSVTSNTPTHGVLGRFSGKIPLNEKVDVTYEEAYLRGSYVTIFNENRTPLSLQEVRVYGTKHVGEVVYNIGYITEKGQHKLCPLLSTNLDFSLHFIHRIRAAQDWKWDKNQMENTFCWQLRQVVEACSVSKHFFHFRFPCPFQPSLGDRS